MMPLIVSAAFKGTALLALAWAATLLVRKSSADLRHRFWLAALVCLPLFMIPLPVPEAARMDVTFTAESLATSATSAQFPWVYVWTAGAALLLARFAWSLIHLASITRRAEGSDVRISAEIASPMTWGIFRPVILIPSYAADWTLAIQHERVHIARFDWLTQSFAQIVTAVFWFHPLVWFAASRLRAEAEQAVDDAVLSFGASPASYAEQLLQVARRMGSNSPVTAVAMVSRPALSGRIVAILDTTRTRHLTSRRLRFAIGFGTLLIVPMLAVLRSSPIPAPAPPPSPAQPVIEPPGIQEPPKIQEAKIQRPRVMLAQATPQPQPLPNAPPPVPAPVVQGTPYPIGAGVSAPQVVYRVQPVYSAEAKAAKYQGEVWLSVVIDEKGIPRDIKVTRQLGLGLDEQAIEAVQKWRFRPGMKEGVPVAVKATIAVSFHLTDDPPEN